MRWADVAEVQERCGRCCAEKYQCGRARLSTPSYGFALARPVGRAGPNRDGRPEGPPGDQGARGRRVRDGPAHR